MNLSNLNNLIEDFRQQQDELLRTKGNDYTMANEDRCHNFKVVAEMLGITPMQCWGVYYLKHVLAIATFVKFGKVESEGIKSRFVDANNYSYLGLALIEDEKGEPENEALAANTQFAETLKGEAVPKVQVDRTPRSEFATTLGGNADPDSLHGLGPNTANESNERGLYRGL